MAKKVTVLVGTKKGMYILRGDANRQKFEVDGPRWAPAPIHHAMYDLRDGSMYAAVNQTWGGSRIEHSRDMGKTWTTSSNPKFPEGSDRTFSQTWHIEPGHPSTPNVVWAGTEPAALFYRIHMLLAHPAENGLHSMRVHEEGYWRDPNETTWRHSTAGLPSNFGFAAAMHPRERRTAYVIPLDGMTRAAAPFGIGVYRT